MSCRIICSMKYVLPLPESPRIPRCCVLNATGKMTNGFDASRVADTPNTTSSGLGASDRYLRNLFKNEMRKASRFIFEVDIAKKSLPELALHGPAFERVRRKPGVSARFLHFLSHADIPSVFAGERFLSEPTFGGT